MDRTLDVANAVDDVCTLCTRCASPAGALAAISDGEWSVAYLGFVCTSPAVNLIGES